MLAQVDLAPRQAAGGINQLNQREANKPIIYVTVRFARIGLLLGLECSNVVNLIFSSSSSQVIKSCRIRIRAKIFMWIRIRGVKGKNDVYLFFHDSVDSEEL